MHLEANTPKLTIAQADAMIDELIDFATLVGECFDHIDQKPGYLTDVEKAQIRDLMDLNTRIIRLIRATTDMRAKL